MGDISDDDGVIYHEDKLYTSDEDENEVLPSEEDDEDDDDEEENLDNVKRFDRFKIEMKKDEMASDLEDDDEEGDLPNSQAWGRDKKMYYHTDYIDKDFRSQKQRDEELAQYEEAEALEIQKRLLESVSENDLGIELLIGKEKQSTNDLKEVDESEGKSETLRLEMTSMKESQKKALIRKESPELEMVMTDFRKYMDEIQHELEPLLHGLQSHNATSSLGLKYLKLRYIVLMNYCTNISFYLALKSSQDKQIVKDHPIIKQLLMQKKVISELDLCRANTPKFSNELSYVSKMLNTNRPIEFVDLVELNSAVQESTHKLPIAQESMEIETDEEGEDEETDGKRAITIEMEKNKGLTPKRKREQRNPRVKYRKKFEKAVVRRKGQVREPRKELHKYGGELTGINVRAVKSVKFK